jgi:hypothetical protein
VIRGRRLTVDEDRARLDTVEHHLHEVTGCLRLDPVDRGDAVDEPRALFARQGERW